MSLRKGFAAALWALRSQRKLSQDDLGDALGRKHVYLIEQGSSTVSIGKLEELSKALGVHPVTLLALSASACEGIPAKELLERALSEVADFEIKGGIELLRRHVEGDVTASKAEESRSKHRAVLRCKSEGMTQREAATNLGMPRSTVAYFWNKIAPE